MILHIHACIYTQTYMYMYMICKSDLHMCMSMHPSIYINTYTINKYANLHSHLYSYVFICT